MRHCTQIMIHLVSEKHHLLLIFLFLFNHIRTSFQEKQHPWWIWMMGRLTRVYIVQPLLLCNAAHTKIYTLHYHSEVLWKFAKLHGAKMSLLGHGLLSLLNKEDMSTHDQIWPTQLILASGWLQCFFFRLLTFSALPHWSTFNCYCIDI